MLTSRKEYKLILGRREILKLIYDIRCFRIIQKEDNDLIRGCSAQYVFLINMNLENRLKRLIELVEDGFAIIHKYPNQEDDTYTQASRLYTTHRDKTDDIRDLENEILKLDLACPKMDAPIVELAKFAEVLPEDYPAKEGVIRSVGKLMSLVPYQESEDIRDYLTKETTIPQWYESYFFKNKTVDPNDFESNFQAILLSTITFPSLERAKVVKKAIEGYTLQKPATVTEETLKKLIYNGTKPDAKLSNMALKVLGSSSQRIEVDTRNMFTILVAKALKGDLDDEHVQIQSKRLFDAAIRVLSVKTTIDALAYALSSHLRGDIAADFIETYLKFYLNMGSYADEFTDKYLEFNTQYLDSKKLDMTPKEDQINT